MTPALSIVMPVYNEEACIEAVIEGLQASILSRLPDSELLAIDDGSEDSTPEILDGIGRRLSQVFPHHKENGGHGDALLYGLQRAEGRYIFLTDSDGQTDPEDFWTLWRERDRSEFICGVRSQRQDPLHRLMISRLLRYGIWILFGVRCRDANAPFKLFGRDFWQRMSPLVPRDTLTPSLFLCVAAKRCLDRIIEVEVRHLPRRTGSCSIAYMKLVQFCMRALYQLLKFRWSMRCPS